MAHPQLSYYSCCIQKMLPNLHYLSFTWLDEKDGSADSDPEDSKEMTDVTTYKASAPYTTSHAQIVVYLRYLVFIRIHCTGSLVCHHLSNSLGSSVEMAFSRASAASLNPIISTTTFLSSGSIPTISSRLEIRSQSFLRRILLRALYLSAASFVAQGLSISLQILLYWDRTKCSLYH